MEFKQFFEIFGMFNYVVPKDKEQQMYDFYMLSLLRGRASSKFVGYGEKPFYEPGNFEPGNLESEEKQADYMLEEVADKLLPYLKKELLSVVSIAVAGEVVNCLIFGSTEKIIEKEHPSSIIEFSNFVNDFSLEAEENNDPWAMSFTIPAETIFKIAKNNFSSVDKFMNVAKTLFLKAEWDENYGGPSWARIVDGYFRLKSATNTNSLIVAIDHVYDLQHNTGSIFTKLKDYDFGRWIEKVLDYKRDVRSSKDLLNKVSPSMKKLASRIIHVKRIP
jgi:hypothetical protein